MSKIITIPLPEDEVICRGKQITFAAPCGCDEVTGIEIDGTTFELRNTAGEFVYDKNAFVAGSLVTVILDTVNNKAYVQGSNSNCTLYKRTIKANEWIEESSGIKKQHVQIEGIYETNNVFIKHDAESIDVSGRDLFIQEEEEYINYIANGYAKTCNGGIDFYIFDEPNTIDVPIVVKIL